MKTRTDSSITVKFIKKQGGANRLSYYIKATGSGSEHARNTCDERTSECSVENLSPGRPYDITVKSCITGASSTVCSDPSEAATIKALPRGK